MVKKLFLSLFAIIILLLSSRTHSTVPTAPVTQLVLPTPTAVPTLTPTPTIPPPLTFSQMNSLYGPCTYLPVLFYHHIQTEAQAVKSQQTSLTVYTPIFRSQMEYLKNNHYNVVSANALLAFFNHQQPIPTKSILLTFDDGYQDFYTDAVPVLKEFGFPSIMFVPTGLMDNPGYLSWSEISNLAFQDQVYIGNHTWSHHPLGGSDAAVDQKEITTADSQISSHGLPRSQVIAYPYGSFNQNSENFSSQLGYQIGFTTRPGSILCAQLRLQLPRQRAGNFSLSKLGL